MGTALLGDLRPVLPETVPDLDVTVRREEERATVDHRIARAVSLLFGGAVVVSTDLSKNRTRGYGRGERQRNKHPGFHVSFSNSSAAAAQQRPPASLIRQIADNADEVMAMMIASSENIW
jgi:hypothetical protein